MSDPSSAVAALLHPALDGAFVRLPRDAAHTDWAGQIPFLCWLVAARHPSSLVALGAEAFPAYLACCETVGRLDLPTRCRLLFDRAAEPSPDLAARHDSRYSAFSRLAAIPDPSDLSSIPDRSIALLIMSVGRQDRPDTLAPWLLKLQPDAVLAIHGLFRDAAGPDAAWIDWLRDRPAFVLDQEPGLAVLAGGETVPAMLAPLLDGRADSRDATRLRDRFAHLGERWRLEARRSEESVARIRSDEQERAIQAELRGTLQALSAAHDRLRDELASTKADRYRLERDLLDASTRLDAQDLRHRQERNDTEARLETGFASVQAKLDAVRQAAGTEQQAQRAAFLAEQQEQRLIAAQALGEAHATSATLRQALEAAERRLQALQNSVSWRLTRPLRSVRAHLRVSPAILPAPEPPAAADLPLYPDPPTETAPAPDPTGDESPAPAGIVLPEHGPDTVAAEPAIAPAPGPNGWRPIRRILFVAGEPGTPGATYRTLRNAAACRAAGYEAECVDIAGVNPDNLAAADLLVLWRAGHSGHVQTMLDLAAAARTRVAFDIDDLIFQPSLAVAEIIDGIRTAFVTEAESRSYFQSMQRTLTNSDLCIATTRELAAAAGLQHPMVQVIPNSFDAEVARASRRAARLRGERSEDGLVRLGYAGGTRTHQRDFATIVPALAAVLADRPQARLTLFRDGRSGEGLVLVDEFPELLPFVEQIEWRDMVPLADLPGELARFDISLCPLELANPFCEAKSELKYFESALAGVCLVASPTAPFRRAVGDGVTGFLPPDDAAWTDTLLRLVDDPALRHSVARNARNDVLWRFGPRRQAELWALLLAQLDGGVTAARAADLVLRRGDYPPAGLPEIPDGELLFSFDRLGEAQVTIGMTSYNYETYLPETLESVSKQSLEHIDLVVVDDGSRDASIPLLLDWAERNRTRFNRLRILRTRTNAGLGGARNLVFDQAETPWIMVLDSDNRLAPNACETLLRAVETDALAAFAYPRIRQFGGADLVMGADDFQPARLASGNYIDAMALIAKWAWAAAGGYYVRRDAMGWEDFSLWCRLVELGLHGVPVPEELGFYRVHASSMVNAITEQSDNKRTMVAFVEKRHPWLRLRMRAARKRLERPAAR